MRAMTSDRRYYPVMLDLAGRTVLVAGGGEVALRKVEGLVGAGAGCIRVVAPEISEEIRRAPGVECRRQAYDAAALDGAALAIAATSSAEVTRRKFSRRCAERSIDNRDLNSGSCVVMPTGQRPVSQIRYC